MLIVGCIVVSSAVLRAILRCLLDAAGRRGLEGAGRSGREARGGRWDGGKDRGLWAAEAEQRPAPERTRALGSAGLRRFGPAQVPQAAASARCTAGPRGGSQVGRSRPLRTDRKSVV